MSRPFVPRPELTLVVGVIGVDKDRFDASVCPGFVGQLGDAFKAIDAACAREADAADKFYEPNRRRVRFLSSFANGAVRYAVDRAPPLWEQEAILPLPASEFAGGFDAVAESERKAFQDFVAEKTAGRCIVLPAERRKDDCGAPSLDLKAARARHGAFLLRQADLLIAIREDCADSDETSELMAKGLERRIPILWLTPEANRDPRLLGSSLDLLPGTGYANALDGPLQDAISRIVAPPSAAASHSKESSSASKRLIAFLGEREPQAHGWFVYQWLRNGPGSLVIRPQKKGRVDEEWTNFLKRAFAMPQPDEFPEGSLADRLMTKLEPRYFAADAIATFYSHAYRSAYVLAFGLSFAATAAAVVLSEYKFAHLVEGLLLVAIFFIVRQGLKGHWHERWLDARMLAEPLRHLRFLALLGETDLARALADRQPPGAIWTAWYLRATIREIGLPFEVVDGARQRSALLATRDGEVEGQISYNLSNAKALSRLHEWLEKSGEWAFIASFAFVIILLIPGVYEWSELWPDLKGPAIVSRFIEQVLKPILEPLALLLPALGATLAGIRYTGDFENFALRSRLTGEALDDLRATYEAALRRLEFDVTAETLGRTAAAMTDDLNSWRSIYASKRITLPG